ncbi:Transcription factor e(y)2 [Teratosphaeria destructans]|uniref:Transcription factor e(Y)2 n=1 Tax=Teratosphaeria destructans TaxID=418781 RepID=A0A9W7SK56_9PEZI|nr:Transcription factor e(y)2 [Teratosphaeria destructans]
MSNKITVNGSSSGHDPALQSKINAALIQNGGVKRIQSTFQQALDEEGWSENLRKYIVELFRSGEVSTYPEAERRVYALINGGEGPYDLKVPESVQERGVAVVKNELRAVCEMEK